MPDPFYQTRQWAGLRSKIRAIWRKTNRPCAYCGKPIEAGALTVVDHLKNRREFPELALDWRNLALMHHACHNKKTHAYDLNTKPEIGLDGFPPTWKT